MDPGKATRRHGLANLLICKRLRARDPPRGEAEVRQRLVSLDERRESESPDGDRPVYDLPDFEPWDPKATGASHGPDDDVGPDSVQVNVRVAFGLRL